MNALRSTLLAVFATVLLVVGRADALELHKLDARDLGRMSAVAREKFERGQGLLDAADYEGARALFQEVTSLEPNSPYAFRQLCEALTALGRRDEAIKTCMGANSRGGSAMDFRSYVHALMSGDKPVSTSDMALALRFARRAHELSPELPAGYAAQCDIANRLGDSEMLNECLKELNRVAPDHPETRRAQAMAASRSNAARIIIGWLVIGLASVGTLFHALWRARQRNLSRTAAVLPTLLLASVFGLFSRAAHADVAVAPTPQPNAAGADAGRALPKAGHLSRWDVDDDKPLDHLPSDDELRKDPLQVGYLIMDLSDKANTAVEKGDHGKAIRYWQAVAKITPDRSHAFSKMCASYEELGALDKAIYTCAAALERTGANLKDYMRYVGLVLSKPGSLAPADIDALDKVITHLRTDATGKGIVDELDCRIGVRLWDVHRLEPCTAALVAARPDHANTVYFQWALAVARGQGQEARQLLERARSMPVDADDLQYMEQETAKLATRWKSHLGIAVGLLVMVVSGAGLLYLSRRRPPKAPKAAATTNAAA